MIVAIVGWSFAVVGWFVAWLLYHENKLLDSYFYRAVEIADTHYDHLREMVDRYVSLKRETNNDDERSRAGGSRSEAEQPTKDEGTPSGTTEE